MLPGAGRGQLQEMALSGLGAQMGSECIPDKSLRVICLISFLWFVLKEVTSGKNSRYVGLQFIV